MGEAIGETPRVVLTTEHGRADRSESDLYMLPSR